MEQGKEAVDKRKILLVILSFSKVQLDAWLLNACTITVSFPRQHLSDMGI